MDNTITRKGILITLTVLMFLLAAPGSSAALDIRVKARAAVSGETVTLGDIAAFSPEGDSRTERLKAIEIASAPAPNAEFLLKRRLLDYKLFSALSDEKNVRLYMPDSLLIKRKGQRISRETLEEIFREHVRDCAPWPRDRLAFDRIRTPGDLYLPLGHVRWHVREKRGGTGRYAGNVLLNASFFVDERLIRKVALSGRVSVRRTLLKAARRIPRGSLITPEDMVLRDEDVAGPLEAEAIGSLEEALGKKARRTIGAGQTVTQSMLEDPPLVKRGANVVILAENAVIRVSTLGKVLEDGRRGERIRVMNLRSGEELLATVMGPGSVRVQF